ncbi:MAG: GntR family transcriptional regulator [Eubacteriales bacterium]
MAKIDFESMKPVYVQIAELIEDDIVSGRLGELENCYSQITISKEMGVNPATAGKGINLLVQKGILVKQRGLSMVVCEGAKAMLVARHKEEQLTTLVESLTTEARKLQITKEELLLLVEQHYKEV